ncbi:TNF receptor-associated factor 4-like isoform X1 [Styela clava]
MMDMHLPGTPVAIDMDDELQELDDEINRPPSSHSSVSIPSLPSGSRPSTGKSSHPSNNMSPRSTPLPSSMSNKSIPKFPRSTTPMSAAASRPPSSQISKSVKSSQFLRPMTAASSGSSSSSSSSPHVTDSQSASPRPPNTKSSVSLRSFADSLFQLPKSASRAASQRPPTAGSRPTTSESRKSSTKSNSGSSTGSMGSRLSMSNLDVSPEEDTQWRAKLRPHCFTPHLSEKYLCPACTNVLYYPVQLSNCDHQVCSSCLSDIMRGVRCCPIDKKHIDRSQVIVRRDFSRELNSKKLCCPQNDLGCSWTGTYENFKEHYSSCEHADENCTNGCGFRSEKRHMDNHLMNECSLRMVTCEFCTRAVRAEKEIDHLKQCPRFPISCSNTCGKKQIPREELARHIEEECPFGEIKCPFNRLGCYVAGTRDFVRRHISDDLANHMEMLCRGLNEATDLLDEHGKAITSHETKIQDTTLQISNVLRTQGCQLLWKVDNWAQRVVEANSGKKTILRSPPFYTGKYGYKLALTLMPNGDGKAKGNCLSLYVCLVKGEYDALASWPFNMTITFTLVDQCQDPRAKLDHVYVLRPNPCKENLAFLGRPNVNANPSFGAQSFAPLDLLETRDYVRDDVIFIKVQTDHEE